MEGSFIEHIQKQKITWGDGEAVAVMQNAENIRLSQDGALLK